ncbi:MAG: ankyrin repeat domain-containing protein [Pyrinomonadaceae bacterium]
MSRTSNLLDQINIPSPCTADWDSMIGNDQVRFCEHCSKSVNNLSTMMRKQALELVSRSKGQLCVRYYKRPDGTVQTGNSQSQLYQLKRRASKIAAGAFSAALGLCSSAVAQAASHAPQSISSSFELVAGKDGASPLPLSRASATLVGTITDSNGAAVPGARLVLINTRTDQAQTSGTNGDGEYRFESLEAGSYTLKINGFGFLPNTVFGIVLQENSEQRIDTRVQKSDVQLETVVNGGAMIAMPDEPLVKATFEGDLQAVKDLLATGIDVNRRDKETNTTALDEAIGRGNREITQALLDAGADVNSRNNRRQTALMRVDDDGTAQLVEDLVRAGAKVNAKDEDGDTALILAASYSNAEVVQALVRAGARIDAGNSEGRSAIMKAAEYGNLEIVKMLFDLGADINKQDREGETALTQAQDNEREEVVKFLKDHNAIEYYRPEKEKKK